MRNSSLMLSERASGSVPNGVVSAPESITSDRTRSPATEASQEIVPVRVPRSRSVGRVMTTPIKLHFGICPMGETYGLRLGATNGLVSTPVRLFFSKHASRRPSAAVLPSNGTRKLAPAPLTSRTSAVRNRSLRARSARVIVTALNSAAAFASIDRDPATRRTGYAVPRSSFHF